MPILLTGSSGFLGSYLYKELKARGHTVFGLSRHGPDLIGDINLPDLGLKEFPKVDAVVHSAALVSFKPSDSKRLYAVNWMGTANVILWMSTLGLKRLFHISTAYLYDHNDYERSKRSAEEIALRFNATIIRPSIIIGDSKVEGIPPLSGFYIVIKAVDAAKRWVEDKTALPELKLVIRIKGNPQGKLNLIPVDVVAKNTADIIDADKQGIFHITHPEPPTLESLAEAVSEAVGVEARIVPDFKANPAERIVALMTKSLAPYLGGDSLKSDICYPPLSREFIVSSVRAFLKA